ncbi:M23 family peptidase [Halobacteriales archaeon SW_7_65_23]|nr:MAG: M23 family peptidase [Halobacteriales archaeon SW_7_65_23]
MTENATATDDADPPSRATAVAGRLRRLLRRFDPTLLGLLGFLSLPAYVSDSLSFLEVFEPFFLFFLWFFVGPIVDMVLARGADEETEPTDWLQVGRVREFAVGYLMIPLTFLNPLVMTQDLLQIAGGAASFLRHRGSFPDSESYEQQVPYRLPVDGTWTVVNGSPEREYSHSWIYPNQRYAYDVLVTDEDGRSRPDGASTAVENYYCHDEPVVAPADGVVVDSFDAALEASRGGGFSHPLKRSIPGGHVVLKHADSEYSFLAHLRPGSVPVEPGQRVERGQEVGRCGHSGNSSEPHLHFQIQDGPDFLTAASLPVQFDDIEVEFPGVAHDPDFVPGYDVWHADDPEDDPEGYHERTFLVEGQRVTHAGGGDADGSADEGRTGTPAEPTTPGGATGLVASTLKRAMLGVAVGGVIAFAVGLFASSTVAVGAIAGAAAVALAVRIVAVLRGSTSRGRTGWFGSPIGFAIAAGAVALGIVVGFELTVAGLLGYVLVSAAESRRLRGVSGQPAAS